MGSNDIPPPHVPSSYHAVSTALLFLGALGYTSAYLLMTLQSLRDRTYAMPLFSLALNLSWEIVFACYVAESLPEKSAFTVWMILDVGLVYAVVKHGAREWEASPLVARNIGKILGICVLWCCTMLWAFSKWWIQSYAPAHLVQGKIYLGVNGIDTTELGWWTALAAQVVLSVMSLAQIVVRGSSRGASWAIWITRFLGSVLGYLVYYGYCWWVWPEAHAYFVHPVAVVGSVTWALADIGFAVVMLVVKAQEDAGGDEREGGKRQGRKRR
ncbi:uncharacterized protein EI97DRAFT_430856 [Westerdykella ornata]|uniref:Integral membrane protein n=1 Tax=Westerdykella ornata TaxID=318751 RepID=A0A6A6JU64_WESOR|nr:uncharacterized protein EI97DRAFT_430856 [Westerdykella ornata]KAF2278579.1 hypothetical protein EI97DRAFT_430856 [Westerdykella ornata]